MDRKPDANTSTLLQAYLAADYQCLPLGQWHPLRIGETAPDVEAAFPEGRTFGLITACNPHSFEQTAAANRAADQGLQRALRASGASFCPGLGAAHDRSWSEPGWLVVDMPLADFDALARRFCQLGALYWRRGEPVWLRMHASSPKDGSTGNGAVDWLA